MTQPRIDISIVEIDIDAVDVSFPDLPIPSPVSANSPVPSPEIPSPSIPSPAVFDSPNLFDVTGTVVAADSREYDTNNPTDVARLNFLLKKYYAVFTPLDCEVRSVPELVALI